VKGGGRIQQGDASGCLEVFEIQMRLDGFGRHIWESFRLLCENDDSNKGAIVESQDY
jgi:hypothetical protein